MTHHLRLRTESKKKYSYTAAEVGGIKCFFFTCGAVDGSYTHRKCAFLYFNITVADIINVSLYSKHI